MIFASREIYRLITEYGERTARLAGRLRSHGELPVVGDWVVCEAPEGTGERIVQHILPRRTRLSRKVAGQVTREQVVAANIDTVFLVMGLDGDFNLRRLERLAIMARESGAEAAVVLTKSDLCAAPEKRRWQAEEAAPGLPVFMVCAPSGEGLDPLAFYLQTGQTVTLVGSSGAGKSTLVNTLCGEEIMATGAVRAGDDRGRHTTTHRQLLLLPGGGLVLDNPGIREVQLWTDDSSGLAATFEDIEALARHCRFTDCRHGDEPGCEVSKAVEDGRLTADRLASFRALERELEHLELKRDVARRRRQERATGRYYRSVIEAKHRRRFGGKDK